MRGNAIHGHRQIRTRSQASQQARPGRRQAVHVGPRVTVHQVKNDERKDQVLAVVRQQFRPEFLNRLDAMVMFNPLDREELMRIARIQIEQLQRRLDERRISIELTEDAQQWLVNTGFDPIYGARPIRRLVQTAVGDKLAVAILSGNVKDGDSVTVGADPDGSGLMLQT